MNLDNAIFLPAIGMVLLTLVVWLRMYTDRLGEMRSKKIHPQRVATARMAGEVLQNVQSADHFRNLFEMPVLFYVLCGFLAITKLTTVLLLAMAWGYVSLRVLHAYIHLTSNQVIRRFQAYAASCIVLWVMWGVFAVLLLMP
jgi:hypothetical protein